MVWGLRGVVVMPVYVVYQPQTRACDGNNDSLFLLIIPVLVVPHPEMCTANLLTCQSGTPVLLQESEQYLVFWGVLRKVTVLERQLVQWECFFFLSFQRVMESGFLTFILVSSSAVYSSHFGIAGMKYLMWSLEIYFYCMWNWCCCKGSLHCPANVAFKEQTWMNPSLKVNDESCLNRV